MSYFACSLLLFASVLLLPTHFSSPACVRRATLHANFLVSSLCTHAATCFQNGTSLLACAIDRLGLRTFSICDFQRPLWVLRRSLGFQVPESDLK